MRMISVSLSARGVCQSPLISLRHGLVRSRGLAAFYSTSNGGNNSKSPFPALESQSNGTFDSFRQLAEEKVAAATFLSQTRKNSAPAVVHTPVFNQYLYHQSQGGAPLISSKEDASKPASSELPDLPSSDSPTPSDKSTPIPKPAKKSERPSRKDKKPPVKKIEEMELPNSSANISSKSDTYNDSVPPAGASSPPSAPPSSGSRSDAMFRPPVIALAVNRRPVLPGHTSFIRVSEKDVIDGIGECAAMKQSFITVFLRKDLSTESSTFNDIEEVHPIGTFCQINGIYRNTGDIPGQQTYTVVLYGHNRVKITDFRPANGINFQSIEYRDSRNPTKASVALPLASNSEKLSSLNIAENMQPVEKEVTEGSDKNDDHLIPPVDNATVAPDSPKAIGETSAKSADQDDDYLFDNNPLNDPSCSTGFLQQYRVPVVISQDLSFDAYDIESEEIRICTADIKRLLDQLGLRVAAVRMFLSNVNSSKNVPTDVMDSPEQLIYISLAVTKATSAELQQVLESTNIVDALSQAHSLLKSAIDFEILIQKAAENTDSKVARKHLEYRIQEQMKALQKELGVNTNDKNVFADKIKERAADLDMPAEVREVYEHELSKLESLESHSAEYGTTRNYLDVITTLPWGKYSVDQYDISKAKYELDKDHYGMKEVKERILEFIAIGKLRGQIDGKIICLVGPPGVGKTSIAKSIAEALNRKFARFSVGGMDDVAELKGHRRTYVGALPGKILQSLKKSATMNPMILIDEIDKLSKNNRGDPASSLLEIFDPEQNDKFMDHYLDVPVDISKTLFVCTANSLQTIPAPLLDRMEVIEVSGYINEEKLAIAQNYLVPNAKKINGLGEVDVSIADSALWELIKGYCRENGVRNLKKLVDKVYRKVAYNFVNEIEISRGIQNNLKPISEKVNETVREENSGVGSTKPKNDIVAQNSSDVRKLELPKDIKPIKITETELRKYLGPALYISDRMFGDDVPPGVVLGLGWTENGGMPVYVECVLEQAINIHSKPKFFATGQLGSVMKESSSLGYSFTKMFLSKKFPENRFFERAMIHLHFPQGGIPKDGPSAGITMATSILSLALDSPINPTIAMTGELTLTGKVLRIGGLKEKTVAAKRCGATKIIFPRENVADWEEIPAEVKEGIEAVPVSWYSEVFEVAFPHMESTKGNTTWSTQFTKIDQETKDSR
ncbi:ATP-dependent protease La [Nadsonia fulvescens var. elongata DSM 6958]|uniref:Lon protease homolog n=1 Tax=Nadsonia fulvescens var. elongata DSM 6958 TaxID=857566 RepID=A0A1E3PFX5_9ASCO|nr:ATP-dependent protease La [Nadsonia fulvescens var. elongata DSM 6958]